MEKTDRKPPEDFFKLIDAIAGHPPDKRKKQARKTGKSKRGANAPSRDSVDSKN